MKKQDLINAIKHNDNFYYIPLMGSFKVKKWYYFKQALIGLLELFMVLCFFLIAGIMFGIGFKYINTLF